MPTLDSPDLVLRSRNVVLAGALRPATVHVREGKIVHVGGYEDLSPGKEARDVGDWVLMAGIVDTHVHINEPGRTEWEGFRAATRAAAAGGVTTVVDMPLNSVPPTTSVRGLEAKQAAAEGQCWVNVGLMGGVVPGNLEELAALRACGVLGFKSFLCDSGVPEFGYVTEDDLRPALACLHRLDAPLLVHAELPEPLARAQAALADSPLGARSYARYLASRPREAENRAVDMMVRLLREIPARAHIVHLSSSDALAPLLRAREDGVRISVETCPHYLALASEEIRDGDTSVKCAPPIRERANRELLWRGLQEGYIDQVVSDHSPSTVNLKCVDSGSLVEAWGGIASLEIALSVTWTAARARGLDAPFLARILCENPAKLVGLERRKGRLEVGLDADLVVWDPGGKVDVRADELEHRNKITPYEGRSLFGRVQETYVAGERVFSRGGERKWFSESPRGALLR